MYLSAFSASRSRDVQNKSIDSFPLERLQGIRINRRQFVAECQQQFLCLEASGCAFFLEAFCDIGQAKHEGEECE